LGIQVVPDEQEHDFDFDLLDATKIIPEELVPVQKIGTLVLNRNVQEFFAEVEQVAFCTANIIPGIDHSNDLLLQGRNFSYHDTQLSRLGGPNFVNLPINLPVKCPVFNNQRDGLHRTQITKGKVNYWPNRFGAPHPVKVADGGYAHAPTPVSGVKIRQRGEKFSEHYNQGQPIFLTYLERS
jgi:catalase